MILWQVVFFWTFCTDNSYDEYLSRGNAISGEWVGEACNEFGISAGTLVRHDQWAAVADNKHAITGKRLTRRKNEFRSEPGFHRGQLILVSNHRPFYDCTISIPKSFSVLFLVGEKKEVLEWHQQAVHKVIVEVERVTTRIDGKGGKKKKEITGKMCAGLYTHFTNRSLEPNLHSHLSIINATPSTDGYNYAVDSAEWVNKASYFTAVYRDAIAAEATKSGYDLVLDKYGAPQIKMLDDMIPLYSERSMDISEMVKYAESIVGATLTDSEKKRLIMASRGIDLPEFRKIWLQERSKLEIQYIDAPESPKTRKKMLAAFETLIRQFSDSTPKIEDHDVLLERWRSLLDSEQLQRLTTLAGDRPSLPPRCVTVEQAVTWAIKHCFEKNSVIQKWELEREAVRYAQGSNLNLDALRACIKSHEALIHKPGGITTKDHYSNECDMVHAIESGYKKGVRLPRIESLTLTEHQLEAVNELLRCGDQFTALLGKAGTGKTRTAEELVRANENFGYKVIAVAPSTKSRDVLDCEDKSTLQLFLLDKKQHRSLAPHDVVLVDECGFASVNQIKKLLNLAVQNSWRIVFSGDDRQNHSIEAGDALRILLQETKIKREWLSDILRQSPDALDGRYLKAAKMFSVGQVTKAFATLDRAGAIKVAQGDERFDQMADMYMEELDQNRSCICVQSTHAENDLLNDKIRDRMKVQGLLGEERKMSVHRSLGLSLAERQDVRNLRIGYILEMTQGLSKGETFEVRWIDKENNYAYGVNNNAMRVRFDSSNAVAWQACQRREISVAVGDTMVTHASMKSKKNGETMNGEKFKVAGFLARGLVTTAGKVIETKNLAFSYSGTSHRSQGDTADTVVFGISRNVTWLNKKISYVSGTRGKTKIAVYCENKAQLIVDKEGTRKSAVELVKYVLKVIKKKRAIRQNVGMNMT